MHQRSTRKAAPTRGEGKELVKSVIIFSSSRVAMDVKIGMAEVRSTYTLIQDITSDEAHVFLQHILGGEEKDLQFIDEVIHKIGTRLLDLHDFYRNYKIAESDPVFDRKKALDDFVTHKFI